MARLLVLFVSILAALVTQAAGAEIFSAGGTFAAEKGYINIPSTVWNPPSNEVQPSQMPFRVPAGKTLLVTDLYLETDPFDHFPFLMVLAGDAGEGARTLRTIHMREPTAIYTSFSTPIPIAAGITLHVIMQNSIPADQSVNWSITGRLVDEVQVVKNEPAGSAKHVEYPYPPITAVDALDLVTLPADEITSDFVADPSTLRMARVITVDGVTEFNRDMPANVFPIWVADAGTKGNRIVDQEAPDCSTFNTVALLGSAVGQFDVVSCIKRIATIDAQVDLKPGQRLQYLKIVDPSPSPESGDKPEIH